MSQKQITRDELLDDIRAVADELGRPPMSTEYTDTGEYSHSVVYKFYDSWTHAVEAAGFDYERPDKHPIGRDGITLRCYHCQTNFRTESARHKVKCRHCGHYCKRDLAIVGYVGTLRKTQCLAKGPATSEDINKVPDQIRSIVDKIQAPSVKHARESSKASTDVVYYLVGDERRAMSLFIEENEEWVREQLERQSSVLRQSWSDELLQLCIEQYYWLGYDEK